MTAPTALTRRTIALAVPTRPETITNDWRHAGICREDPDLFFPAGKTGPFAIQIEQAKAVCRRCPVMEQCGEWALENREMDGIYGGMDEDERRRLLRRARRRMPGNKNPEQAWVQILRDRRPEFLALRSAGSSVNQIALELGTNTQTVHNVLRALDAEAGAAAEAVAA